MYLWEEIIVSIGVALEIFAVAMIKGANQEQLPAHMFLEISLFCGGIETVLLFVGTLVVSFPVKFIHNKELLIYNRWIAASILVGLGVKGLSQIKEKIHIEEQRETRLSCKQMIVWVFQSGKIVLWLGIVLALLNTITTGIWLVWMLVSLAIGLGLWLGERIGSGYKVIADGISGIILLGMGLKVAVDFLEMI